MLHFTFSQTDMEVAVQEEEKRKGTDYIEIRADENSWSYQSCWKVCLPDRLKMTQCQSECPADIRLRVIDHFTNKDTEPAEISQCLAHDTGFSTALCHRTF